MWAAQTLSATLDVTSTLETLSKLLNQGNTTLDVSGGAAMLSLPDSIALSSSQRHGNVSTSLLPRAPSKPFG